MTSRSGSFAVKRLLSENRAQFEREVEMLESFSGDGNPHLISLLATYEQNNVFYLIFFWAEADLQSFWRDVNPIPKRDYSTVLWMAEQCLGIAKGLSALHNYTTFSHTRLKSVFGKSQPIHGNLSGIGECQLFGVHGDIKPRNVLWYKDISENAGHGTLKISDFGLAEFKTDPSEIYKPSEKVAYSASYRPPERDSKNAFVGRSHDIWALGCLYLEMIAWMLGGWQLVQNFQERRAPKGKFSRCEGVADAAFFHIESLSESGIATVAVKPAVTQADILPLVLNTADRASSSTTFATFQAAPSISIHFLI
ncbi:hypothetical protein Daus18300_011894 [Diaporthe australafricana]|uniref:Protein kinase domain-containing protein n=1 Tax=Diaporthe australafricana TaxID=127596 RepID=A0ABR3W4S9_9PEZI